MQMKYSHWSAYGLNGTASMESGVVVTPLCGFQTFNKSCNRLWQAAVSPLGDTSGDIND